MTVMRAFEIHTFQRGRWVIDSVFDDRELAIFEARRMDEAGRYAGIRVVEETFDQSAGMTQTRTLFRGSKVMQANEDALERSREQRRGAAAAQRERSAQQVRRRRAAAIRAKQQESNPYRLIAILSALFAIGVGALIGLNHVQMMRW